MSVEVRQMLTIREIAEGVAQAAREFPIKKAELFGSYARGTATEKSDVDLLMEFEEPAVSLFMLSDLQYRMEDLLNCAVDVLHGPLPEGAMIEIDKKVPVYGA